jgi:hypothetical protein
MPGDLMPLAYAARVVDNSAYCFRESVDLNVNRTSPKWRL